MMRVLALDYGDRRIGVSVSDPMMSIAFGAGVIGNGRIEAVISAIKGIIDKYGDIGEMIVGMPYSMKGQEGAQADKVGMFVEKLRQSINMPVKTIDERLSTKEATRKLHDAGYNARSMKGHIDEASAMTILQAYLDSKK